MCQSIRNRGCSFLIFLHLLSLRLVYCTACGNRRVFNPCQYLRRRSASLFSFPPPPLFHQVWLYQRFGFAFAAELPVRVFFVAKKRSDKPASIVSSIVMGEIMCVPPRIKNRFFP